MGAAKEKKKIISCGCTSKQTLKIQGRRIPEISALQSFESIDNQPPFSHNQFRKSLLIAAPIEEENKAAGTTGSDSDLSCC